MSKVDVWDLKPLFKDKKTLLAQMQQTIQDSKDFEETYKGKLQNINSKDFQSVIEKYEANYQAISQIMTYSFLLFASDTSHGAFYSQCELECNKAQESLLFFELEFNSLDDTKKQEIIKSSPKYSYYLELLVQYSKFQLSLLEEKVLLKVRPAGSELFSRLFDEHFSKLKFKFDNKLLSEEEVLSLLYSEDRKIRKKASISLSKTLKDNIDLLTYILNAIRKDLKITKELRGYESLEHSRHISNQTTQKSVDCMVDTINENVKIVEEYYKIKSKILKIKNLQDYDRYAPIPSKDNTEFDYITSKTLVLETFQGFSNKFYKIAKEAFENGWIDSHPRDRKRGGAFSHGATPNAHPYLMLNHTNQRRDIFTMAHELGHTIHQKLSYSVGYLNADTPLTTAETASVFAEMLLFDKLKNQISDDEKISLYAGKLEDIFATLFRQNVFTNFERRIHNKEGELSSDEISNIWQEENQKMFGDSLKLSDNYKLWWSYIPHFIHSPFYCYAYSYGQLLVMALFGLYKQNKDDFIPKYERFLSLGGSKSPKELVEIFGFDIEDRDFWKIGIKEVKDMLDELKTIINKGKTC